MGKKAMGNAKKEDTLKDKKTPNLIRNQQQKAKSRDAARNRRKNENDNIEQLTRLVPWIPDNPPDKSTIIRLSTSWIGLMKVLNGSSNGQMIDNGCSETKGIENLSLEAIDGFVIILSKDGTIIFVNEKIVNYLGFPPHELMGKKIYNFVLKKDWGLLAKKLRGPLPKLDNPNVKEPQGDPDDVICEPRSEELMVPFFENAVWNEKTQFSVRMQCNVIRRTSSSKSTGFQVVRFTGRINQDGYFMGTGEHAWSPDLGDLPVYEPAFISRLSSDLKLLFCEGRIRRYMDCEAKDIVGRVAYTFYHPTDCFHIQKMHSKLLAEGKVTTVPYRWMNKDGGWVWLQSTTTRILDERTGKTYMLCVNYVLSAIENKGVVVGVNPEKKGEVIEKKSEKENEHDSDDAYLVDELTDVFTRATLDSPAPSDTCQATENGYGNVFNGNYSQSEPQYMPSFTSQEAKAKPLLEFYTQEPRQNSLQNGISMQEKVDNPFERFSWPNGDNSWRAEEQLLSERSDLMNGHQNDHLFEHSLQDLIGNGQFALHVLPPGNNGESLDQHEAQQMYMNEQYANYNLEESFKQQAQGFVPNGCIKTEPTENLPDDPGEVIADSFDMPDILYLPDAEEIQQEQNAYQASMYLFTNEIPLLNSKHIEPPLSEHSKLSTNTYAHHQRQNNGFTQDMCFNGQEQHFSQVNHNNNVLPFDIMNVDGLAEDACIFDFDQTLLESN